MPLSPPPPLIDATAVAAVADRSMDCHWHDCCCCCCPCHHHHRPIDVRRCHVCHAAPGCGLSRPWAGRSRRASRGPIWLGFIPRPHWRQGTTSFSSGWRGEKCFEKFAQGMGVGGVSLVLLLRLMVMLLLLLLLLLGFINIGLFWCHDDRSTGRVRTVYTVLRPHALVPLPSFTV